MIDTRNVSFSAEPMKTTEIPYDSERMLKRKIVERKERADHSLEDHDLFRRFLDGDDQAFMSLFHRHSPRLFAYAAKITGEQERARDILQDVWERMARLRDRGDEAPSNPLGLLITTTRNLCLNHKRDRKDHLSLDNLDLSRFPGGERREMSAREEAVVASLDYLPEEQREVLILHNYSGYSYEEIATMLEESPGAIRNRAWRGRHRMGQIIVALIAMEEDSSD